jgi:hypothetical protein
MKQTGPAAVAFVVAAVLLAVGAVVAYHGRDSSAFANFAGIFGLCVGVVGFAVTIYTLVETQRVSRKAEAAIVEAAARAERTVRQAQQQMRRAIDLARRSVRNAESADLLRRVRELQQAAEHRDWHRALFQADECARLARSLAADESLGAATMAALRARAEDMAEVRAFIRLNRMSEEPGGLQTKHEERLEALDNLLVDTSSTQVYAAFNLEDDDAPDRENA